MTTPKSPKHITKAPVIIGIAGLARSGKDTIADFLQEALNDSKELQDPFYGRYSFATPLKQMLEVGLGMVDKDPRAEDIYGATYRKLAQTLGTEWGRNTIDPSIWLKTAEFRLIDKTTIISDVRFEDEAEFCRKHGILIHVTRDLERPKLSASEATHMSEAGVQVKHGDYKILNEGSNLHALEDLVKGPILDDILRLLKDRELWSDMVAT